MALQSEKIQEFSSGFNKEIDESSKEMMMDLIQVYQYQYPVKSTIRELVSNAVDAVRERDVAQQILTGKAKEADYFIRRDDPKFKDSNFDSSYYDLKWLSNDPAVKIIYEEGDLGKDRVHIIDNGTGLGGKRLEGYFRLGYSTKRNSKLPLGKFGIGAKAGLSTGVDYYTVLTRYNGMEFRFNVYSHKVDSIVPSLDIKTGKDNPSYTFSNGHTAFYLPTKALNGTEVILESKKHKKQEYIDAVKQQLLYFNNVTLVIKKASGYEEPISFKANILYEDDLLIVSDNTYYSKPHLVINNVNYGFVDFGELELEDKMGNVGIKVAAEEVTVNPSRESVVWNEATKSTIQKRFGQAAGVATKIIQKQLNNPDFFQWLKAFLMIRSQFANGGGTDVVSRLAGIIDVSSLEPAFSRDSDLKAGRVRELFPGIKLERFSLEKKTRGGVTKKKMSKSDVKVLSDINPTLPFIISHSRPSIKKLHYLISIYQEGYYLIRYPGNLDQSTGTIDETVPDDIGDDKKDYWIAEFDLTLLRDDLNKDKKTQTTLEKLLARRKSVVGFMEESKIPTVFETIKVPDTFDWSEDDFDDDSISDAVINIVKEASPEERRKLEQRVVLFTPRGFGFQPTGEWDNTKKNQHNIRLFEWQKVEPKLVQVQNLEGEDVYYGFDADSAILQFVAALTAGDGPDKLYGYKKEIHDTKPGSLDKMEEWGLKSSTVSNTNYLGNWMEDEVVLMKVAQNQAKLYKQYHHISEFFKREQGETITMSNRLIRWYTAKLINDQLEKFKFLNNWQPFDKVISAKYKKLKKYWQENFRDIEDEVEDGSFFGMEKDAYQEMLAYQENLKKFQLFVRQNPKDTEAIAELSTELFSKEYTNAGGVDLKIYDTLQDLIEYTTPVSILLNQIKPLTKDEGDSDYNDEDLKITPELEAEIRSYIEFKGL